MPTPNSDNPSLSADQQLQVLMQCVRDYAFITYNLDNRITSWSAGAERILGWSASEANGQSGEIVFTPEDRASGAIERELTIARNEGRAEDERWHVRKDGSRFWASGILTLLRNDAGLPIGFAKVLRDLTDRRYAEAALRESEQRFRLFVENVREYALFQTDVNGRVTSWNPGAERLFGYTRREMMGQPASCLFPVEDQRAGVLEKEISRILADDQQQDSRWLVRKDGSQFWAQWITEAVRDEAGQIRGVAKVLRDETERRRSEQILRASLAEKEALLREIHHRVKNNLQVVVSLLSLQAQQIDDPVAGEMFRDTEIRVRSIAAIHENLYTSEDLAEIEFGAYASGLIEELFALYGVAKDRIGFQFVAEDMALTITQAIPLGLILNELVVNCFKHAFGDGRSGTIRVSLRYAKELLAPHQTLDDGLAEMCVEDDGSGLPENFDLGSQTSMGLYLVRILSRQLQGEVQCHAAEPTRICVRFPLTLEEARVEL
jgi:PAS domain S-box-containing protein